jgi:uncharacterized protein
MLKNKTSWISLAIAAALLISTLTWNPLQASGQVNTGNPLMIENLLTVSGQGKERIRSTLAQVSLGVEAQGAVAATVQAKVASQATSVVNYLKSKSVERLQTAAVNLSPSYRYDNGKQTLVGYMASTSVTFRVPAEAMSEILDNSVKAGATRIDSLSFTATDAEIKQAQQIALKEATQDAQVQADAVLSALNLTRKDIIGIQINGASAPPPVIRATAMEARTAKFDAASTPVESGEQEINASVTLQIRY